MNAVLLVETNFIVGLVLDREENAPEAMRELLEMARQRKIALALPAFALAEATSVLRSVRRDRNRLRDELFGRQKEMSRHAVEAEAVRTLDSFRAELLRSGESTQDRFREIAGDILAVATVQALDAEVLRRAFAKAGEWGLDTADATVLASCEAFRATRPEIRAGFLTMNANDFDTSTVRSVLDAIGCSLFTHPQAALAWGKGQSR